MRRDKRTVLCSMYISNDDLKFQIEQLDKKLQLLLSVIAQETFDTESTNGDIWPDVFGLIYISWPELFQKCRAFVKSYEELHELLVRASKTFVLIEYTDEAEAYPLGYYFDEEFNQLNKVRNPDAHDEIMYLHYFHSVEIPLIEYSKREYRDDAGETANERIQAYIRLKLPPYLIDIVDEPKDKR